MLYTVAVGRMMIYSFFVRSRMSFLEITLHILGTVYLGRLPRGRTSSHTSNIEVV